MSPTPASLVYFPDNRPGIRRERRGKGFSYVAPDGTRIDCRIERARIASLAVPPAYEDVWICPRPNGHLQATGRDTRARKQYRYHPDWTEFRSQLKYGRLAEFGRALPKIRRRMMKGLAAGAGQHEFALAAVVAMIDRLSIRIGNEDYAEENGTYGATTLTSKHVKLGKAGLRLVYNGKGNKKVERGVSDRTLMKALQELDDLPGGTLVSWIDDDGRARSVTSDEVNTWLAEVSGLDTVTAKTFRTWNGSTAALSAAVHAEKVTIKAMADAAAERLCNTPTIARNSYIHPAVIALSEDPSPLGNALPEVSGLRADERRLLGLLEGLA